MRAFLRKCRGALGLSVLSAATWAIIFAAISVVVGILDPGDIDAGEGPLHVAPIGAVFGFVSGVVFSLLLALGESRNAVRDLSIKRAALWGMLGTAAYPLLTPVDDIAVLIFGPVGAALAAATVAVAKRAELGSSREQPKLPG
jgi:hypothetical protein